MAALISQSATAIHLPINEQTYTQPLQNPTLSKKRKSIGSRRMDPRRSKSTFRNTSVFNFLKPRRLQYQNLQYASVFMPEQNMMQTPYAYGVEIQQTGKKRKIPFSFLSDCPYNG
ncbi:hypothetical protein CIPAW_08G097400 [Carya illinoinensis]|uniref:Uncharacterized protein n=1 Tax=Carya illinoinensis TaxID=32201 RepID=A0A8T1PUH9_CARIL|nr:hypothetical protein CIPAW_08G097400 [Carya illinoinensis]